MPPSLTLIMEVILICGLTVWQIRRLANIRNAQDVAVVGEELELNNAKFDPRLAFGAFWLQCFGASIILWLFEVVTNWSRLGDWDVSLNVLGVILTVAFVLGLGVGIWLFASWWLPVIRNSWANFSRPRPRPRSRRRFNFLDAEAEVEPNIDEQNFVAMDLPPYHELKSPNANSELKWCDDCGRWMGWQHRHDKIAV